MDNLEKLKSDRRFKIALIIVAFAVIFLFFCLLYFKDKEITLLLIGNVTGILATVMGFYFTSTDNEKKEKENEP